MADENTDQVEPSTTETTDPLVPPADPIVPVVPIVPAQPTVDVVDEAFEPVVPENIEIDKESLSGFKTFALEKGLTKTNAQSFLDFMIASREKHTKDQETATAEAIAKNLETIKADPVIGGINFEKVQKAVDSLTLKYGGEDFKNQINTYGFKNDPSFLRFISNLNNSLTEDKVITPNHDTSGGDRKPSYEKTAEEWFPPEKP